MGKRCRPFVIVSESQLSSGILRDPPRDRCPFIRRRCKRVNAIASLYAIAKARYGPLMFYASCPRKILIKGMANHFGTLGNNTSSIAIFSPNIYGFRGLTVTTGAGVSLAKEEQAVHHPSNQSDGEAGRQFAVHTLGFGGAHCDLAQGRGRGKGAKWVTHQVWNLGKSASS